MFVILLLFGGCSHNNPVQPPVDKTVIKGTVTDSLTGQPLPGTMVILNTGLSATADISGNYRLVGMGGGTFTLRYEKYDWRRKSEDLTVAANDSAIVDTVKLHRMEWEIVDISLQAPWSAGYLQDVCFINENEGWAVGSDEPSGYPGYIIHTTDGGYTWEMQFGAAPIDAWYFHNVDFIDNLNGWAVADANQMKRTTDGGITWQNANKPFTGYCYAMDFIDNCTGWIAQYYGGGGIYKTVDGGQNWTKLAELPDSGLCDMKFLDNNRGLLRSPNNICSTLDGGVTWTLRLNKPYSGAGQYSKIELLPPNNIWLEGFYSRDGGLNWIAQNSDIYGPITAISFFDVNYGWMGGGHAFFIGTTDGGETWREIDMPHVYTIFSMQCISPWLVFAVADGIDGVYDDIIMIYK